MKEPVIIVVMGGVAYSYCDETKVDVRIVDLDNLKCEEELPVQLPSGVGFEALAAEAGVDDEPYVEFI